MAGTVVNDMSILIGGDAGQGVESSGAGLCQAFARAGLQVFAMQDYRSRIRGGHNFYQARLSEHPIYSHSNPVHLVLALTARDHSLAEVLQPVGAGVDDLVVGGEEAALAAATEDLRRLSAVARRIAHGAA